MKFIDAIACSLMFIISFIFIIYTHDVIYSLLWALIASPFCWAAGIYLGTGGKTIDE